MRICLLISVIFLAGCSSPVDWSIPNPFGGSGDSGQGSTEVVHENPMQSAAGSMTRYGVLLIVGGVIFAAFTRFQTGWGASAIAAGVLMILLAWTFRQWWLPWTALLTILAYAGYKLWNRFNPDMETEPLIK